MISYYLNKHDYYSMNNIEDFIASSSSICYGTNKRSCITKSKNANNNIEKNEQNFSNRVARFASNRISLFSQRPTIPKFYYPIVNTRKNTNMKISERFLLPKTQCISEIHNKP